jgi:mono/diheme cytochrome c family protein
VELTSVKALVAQPTLAAISAAIEGESVARWIGRQAWLWGAVLVVVVAPWAHVSSHAAEKGLEDKGERLVRENCSRCHAIGKEGTSPHKEAPPFRTLSQKYPIEDLAESLAEGIVSGHPDMPIFAFSPHDVEAIVQYLNAIQVRNPS